MPDSGDLLIHRRVPANASAYEVDFYDWCLIQARALRARIGTGDDVDWGNIAEELDGLARADHHACRSYLVRIMEHLLKIEFLDRPEEVEHHSDEIRAFRGNLNDVLSPSLRSAVPNWVEPLYYKALRLAQTYARHSRRGEPLPSTCIYTWDDVIGRADGEWVPEPRRASD